MIVHDKPRQAGKEPEHLNHAASGTGKFNVFFLEPLSLPLAVPVAPRDPGPSGWTTTIKGTVPVPVAGSDYREQLELEAGSSFSSQQLPRKPKRSFLTSYQHYYSVSYIVDTHVLYTVLRLPSSSLREDSATGSASASGGRWENGRRQKDTNRRTTTSTEST